MRNLKRGERILPQTFLLSMLIAHIPHAVVYLNSRAGIILIQCEMSLTSSSAVATILFLIVILAAIWILAYFTMQSSLKVAIVTYIVANWVGLAIFPELVFGLFAPLICR